MQLFFGDDFDAIVTEFRGQAVKMARIQTVKRFEGDRIIYELYVSTYANEIVYQAMREFQCPIPTPEDVEAQKIVAETEAKIKDMEQALREKMRGMEVKKGLARP